MVIIGIDQIHSNHHSKSKNMNFKLNNNFDFDQVTELSSEELRQVIGGTDGNGSAWYWICYAVGAIGRGIQEVGEAVVNGGKGSTFMDSPTGYKRG